MGLIPLSQLLSARNCAVSKQEKLFSLASVKGDNVNSLVLKSLNDSKVTDDELYLIRKRNDSIPTSERRNKGG